MAKKDPENILKEEGVKGEVKYSAIKVIIGAIAQTSALIITNEFIKAMGDDKLREGMAVSYIMPYLYTAGFLSFAGRDINKENMTRVMTAMGATPQEDILDILLGSKIEGHLIYVYAFYYLLANGKNPSEANIGEIVKSLGMKPSSEAIKYVMGIVSSPWKFP